MTTARWRPPLSVAVLAVPAAVGAVRLVIASHHAFDFAGDEAILESGVRHVGRQLVGPYSRFGFHHPGPAYFWLMAPFYRSPGASPAALFLGAFCINLGAALGCVLVVRRFLGEQSARWGAVAVGALLVCLTPALLANLWTPYVLALPVLLAMLLAAAGSRSPAAAGGAVVVASYIVQTHVATAATIGAVIATAALVAALHHRMARPAPSGGPPAFQRSRPPRRWTAPAATVVLLVLIWAPPLIEQVTRSPGNITALARFFRESHPEADRGIDHGLGSTAGQVAAGLTVLPFGHDRDPKPTDAWKVVLAVVGVLIGAGVAVAGWQQRQPVVASLGAMSVVGPMVAVWSSTRIVGEVHPYLLVWTSALLLPAVIGAAALLIPRFGPPDGGARRLARHLAGAATVAVGLSLTVTMTRHPLVPYPPAVEATAAARLAEPWLAGRGVRQVRIRIVDHDRWPQATGVAVRLEKDGFTSTVDQDWTFLFGEHFRPTGHEQATIWLAGAGGMPAAGPALTPLGVVGATSIWAGPAEEGPPR